MKSATSTDLCNWHRDESGQATVFVVIAIGLFLLGSLGFAAGITNLWFHRQTGQTAADAACTAGAMDLLLQAQGTSTYTWIPSSPNATFQPCSASPSIPPCKYAAKNGYNGTGRVAGTASNDVYYSFPSSVTGATAPPAAMASTPFLRITVFDRTPVFLAGLLSASTTRDVVAQADCGLVLSSSPIPIVVLNPTVANSLSTQGNPNISIVGGPTKSIQVDSKNAAAVNVGGSSKIDLSQGGPNRTGSDLGAWGGPTAAPGGFIPGTTGHWLAPATPIGDPFAQLPAPAVPAAAPAKTTVAHLVDGCPDPGGCDEYWPGHYTSLLQVKGATAIFVEGLYYLDAGMALDSNSTVRPSTHSAPNASDQIGGTMFYLGGSSTLSVASNSGSKAVDYFPTMTGTGVYANGAKCTASSTMPGNLPAAIGTSDGTTTGTLVGANILLAPCTGTYGDPLGASDPIGEQRGMLFFQDRSAGGGSGVNPNWGGGGQFLLAGNMYFHQCNSSTTGAGTNCATSGAYNDVLSLQGNSGSGTYVLGDIIVDQLQLGGSSGITMDLNPSRVYNLLKVGLFR
jgi:hypothetical protein